MRGLNKSLLAFCKNDPIWCFQAQKGMANLALDHVNKFLRYVENA